MKLYKAAYESGMKIMRYEKDPKIVLLGSVHTLNNAIKQYCFLNMVLTSNDAVCLEGILAKDDPTLLLSLVHTTLKRREIVDSMGSTVENESAWNELLSEAYKITPKHFLQPDITSLITGPPVFSAVRAGARVYGMEDRSLISWLADFGSEENAYSHFRDGAMSAVINSTMQVAAGQIFVIVGERHVPNLSARVAKPPAVFLADGYSSSELGIYYNMMLPITFRVRAFLRGKK